MPDEINAWEATTAKQKSIELFPLACSSREEELWRKFVATKADIEQARLTLEASRAHSEEKCQRLFVEFKKNGTRPVPTLRLERTFGWLNDTQFRNDDRMRAGIAPLKAISSVGGKLQSLMLSTGWKTHGVDETCTFPSARIANEMVDAISAS